MKEEIEEYIMGHIDEEPEALARIDHDTHVQNYYWHMCSGHIQGRLLKMLTRMIRPRRVLELGTFSGYSALCLAEGLADDDCYVDTIEINDEQEDFIREHLALSPYSKRVRLHIGDARDIVPSLGERYDLVFIDANKRQYVEYYDLVMEYLNDGGFIIADNTLWDGKVASVENLKAKHDAQTNGIMAFNDRVKNDTRVEKVIVPLRDGLTLIHKLPHSTK
jgi:predicted O-methyltransferase YrrM